MVFEPRRTLSLNTGQRSGPCDRPCTEGAETGVPQASQRETERSSGLTVGHRHLSLKLSYNFKIKPAKPLSKTQALSLLLNLVPRMRKSPEPLGFSQIVQISRTKNTR